MATSRVSFPFTQRQAFEALTSLVKGGALAYLDKDGATCAVDADAMAEFLAHRIAQTEKKTDAPRKPTAAQLANQKLMEDILANMEAGVKYTIGDMILSFDCFEPTTSPQRVSALLSKLGAKGTNQIVRTEEKGKAYFALAE